MSISGMLNKYVCCTCPDGETEYSHPCACPSAYVECESSELSIALANGYSEFAPTVPPKKFLSCSLSGSITFQGSWKTTQSGTKTLNLDGTVASNTWLIEGERADNGGLYQSCTSTICQALQHYDSGCGYPYKCADNVLAVWSSAEIVETDTSTTRTVTIPELNNGASPPDDSTTGAWVATLGNEDTEDAARERATAVAGTSCSSMKQTRTTSTSWIERTANYTIKATNLLQGAKYNGCVRLRKREAYAGATPEGGDTSWIEVEPDLITNFIPSSTNTEDGVTTVDSAVNLPYIDGWEYEVIDVNMWLATAPCECASEV